MIANVAIVRRSLPGVIAIVLRLAEMHVGEVDEMPVLVVARDWTGWSPLGSSGMLRFSQAGICASSLRMSVPGLHLHIDPAGLAAPAGQELAVLRIKAVEVEPQDRVDLDARVLRNVLEHADDLEVARDALR